MDKPQIGVGGMGLLLNRSLPEHAVEPKRGRGWMFRLCKACSAQTQKHLDQLCLPFSPAAQRKGCSLKSEHGDEIPLVILGPQLPPQPPPTLRDAAVMERLGV